MYQMWHTLPDWLDVCLSRNAGWYTETTLDQRSRETLGKTMSKKLKPMTQVEVIRSNMSTLSPGMRGVIRKQMPGGYAVYFRHTNYTAQFGGASKTRPATVFLERNEFRVVKKLQRCKKK